MRSTIEILSFHRSAADGDLAAIKSDLDSNVDVGLRDMSRRTALHAACAASQYRAVWFLTEAGADPNAEDRSGWTPLHVACERGDFVSIRALLAAGADPRIRVNGGAGPLHILAMCPSANRSAVVPIAGLLVRHGACPLTLDWEGHSSLTYARRYKNWWCLRAFRKLVCASRSLPPRD